MPDRWTSVFTATAGMRYDGLLHPLSAYTRKSEQEPWLPFLTPEEGFRYRDWPALVMSTVHSRPPGVISYFALRRRDLVPAPRLVAFGYAMDSMKPLRWCRAETPLITVTSSNAGPFTEDVAAVVAASEEVRKTFSFQVKAAWSDRPADLDVFSRVNPAFWSATEPAFFATVQALKRGLEAGDAVARDAAREGWLEELHRAAMALFDSFIEVSAEIAAPDLRRAVNARRNLEQFTRPSSTKLRELLGLTVEESATRKKSKDRKPRKEPKP
jgi:CRISPR system Cascade subunit CasA